MPGGAHWSEACPTAAPGGEAQQGANWATLDQNPGREAASYMQPGRPGRTIQTRSTGQGAAEGRRPTGQAIGRIPRPEGSWRVPTESMPMSMRQQGNGGAQEGKLPEQQTPAVHWEDEMSDEEEGGRGESTLQIQCVMLWKRYPIIMKDTTCARLGLYVLQHIRMMQARGEQIPQPNTSEYITLYVQILDLEAHAYLYRKASQGSAASTPEGAHLIPSLQVRPVFSPHLEEAMSNIYAPQQPGESDDQFAARLAAAQ
ncbi:hypothetical protein C0992_009208 [Termitomyces sp. T32_za158]|nr:hypothetical protein C0992_009208 [Termitomyces sp. T32_za158]